MTPRRPRPKETPATLASSRSQRPDRGSPRTEAVAAEAASGALGSEVPDLDAVVRLFKVLADPTRLRIVGLLSEEPRCGQELAETLRLSPGTVTHHLRLLREAGLLRERRRPPYTDVELDFAQFQRAVKSVLKRERVRQFASRDDLSSETRAVLDNFFDGDRLTSIPAQRRKKEIVFEEILRRIPRQETYREPELNELIRRFHSDFCTIRREFIMGRYMTRERGVYRLGERGRAVVQTTA